MSSDPNPRRNRDIRKSTRALRILAELRRAPTNPAARTSASVDHQAGRRDRELRNEDASRGPASGGRQFRPRRGS